MLSSRVIRNWKSPDNFIMPDGQFKENLAGEGRRSIIFTKAPLSKEAFSAFGITNVLPYKRTPNFIGNHYKDGAFTHEHIDSSIAGFIHVRCNWMIKKPSQGGDPIISGKVIPVEEGDLWVCFSSLEKHASTPISGGERLICSFGGLISIEDLNKL